MSAELRFGPGLVAAARALDTPCLVLDQDLLLRAYRALRSALPGAELFYAMKANPHDAVVAPLAADGCGFEVASTAELELAARHGVPPERIISSNSVKTIDLLRRARALGVDRFAFDSEDELQKIGRFAPGARVYCRVVVDNSGSDWPLSRKFGVPAGDAVPMLLDAAALGLRPHGLSFHVGSQCRDVASWRRAIETCAAIWQDAARAGLRLEALNLGGGFPVRHLRETPSWNAIGTEIGAAVAELLPPGVRLVVEPGRAIVGGAAVLVTSVIGKARRGDERWIYLDAGVFNGLMEAVGGLGYELRTERDGPTSRQVVAGPTCDSMDVIATEVELPELEVGDRVYVMNAGAYTLSYASRFNGFAPPELHLLPGVALPR
ncbi:MAG TPA: type III PLP-dependent enzyme [Chloroflexota bacterium]|nr:type III PLP-dependent enzyme [Chloroflexota bacterium]